MSIGDCALAAPEVDELMAADGRNRHGGREVSDVDIQMQSTLSLLGINLSLKKKIAG